MKRSKKRGLFATYTLVSIALIITGAIVVGGVVTWFLSHSNEKSAEEICRGSLGLQQVAKIKKGPLEVRSPLLCKTIKKEVPEEGAVTKEAVKESFANMIDRCWWMFGNGMIEDVFQGSVYTNKCFVCYEATVKEGKEFKFGKDKVSVGDILYYIATKPKEVKKPEDQCYFGKGECIPEDENCGEGEAQEFPYLTKSVNGKCPKKDGTKQKCCIGTSDCANSGGKCADTCKNDAEGYIIEMSGDGYSCPDQKKCCVRRDNFVSHFDYVQDFKGEGAVLIANDIEPGETYAVGFMSPSHDCGDRCWLGIKIGGVGGGVAGAAGLLLGGACAATGFLPCLIVLGVGGATFATIGAVGGYAIEKGGAKVEDILKNERNVNTIVVAKRSIIEGQCSIVSNLEGD